MTNVHIHVPEQPFWDKDIYGSAMHNGVPAYSKLGRGPRGYKGEKGDTGATGATGEDGFSPWAEFEYPVDPEPGHPVLVIHDREGEHRYALDPKPDPAQLTDDDLWKLSAMLRDPNWLGSGVYYDYREDLSNESPVSGTWYDSFPADKLTLIGNGDGYQKFPDTFEIYKPDLTAPGWYYTYPYGNDPYAIGDIKFSRNGLEYAAMSFGIKDAIDRGMFDPPVSPCFFPTFEPVSAGSSDYRLWINFYPKLDTGHKLEDCMISVRWIPVDMSD